MHNFFFDKLIPAIFLLTFLAFTAAVAQTTPNQAQAAVDDFKGEWELSVNAPQGAGVTAKLRLFRDGEKYFGFFESEYGDGAIAPTKIVSGKLSANIHGQFINQDMVVELTAAVKDNKMSGTFTAPAVGAPDVPFVGSRQSNQLVSDAAKIVGAWNAIIFGADNSFASSAKIKIASTKNAIEATISSNSGTEKLTSVLLKENQFEADASFVWENKKTTARVSGKLEENFLKGTFTIKLPTGEKVFSFVAVPA